MYDPTAMAAGGVARPPRSWMVLLALVFVVLITAALVLNRVPGRVGFQLAHWSGSVPVEVVMQQGPGLGSSPADPLVAGTDVAVVRAAVIAKRGPLQFDPCASPSAAPMCWLQVPASRDRLLVATPQLRYCAAYDLAARIRGRELAIDSYEWGNCAPGSGTAESGHYWLLSLPLDRLPRGELNIEVSVDSRCCSGSEEARQIGRTTIVV